ncbi:hypothetical protein GC105_11430 [Alkalibaculum sp. M08DMB]|uniref:Uncharacterized protein n=1 Tax=Alkalibaculum sporogenes TaxID=2655001 RepID=A0A6A7KA84_9FIRM|nr:hypothetical protein [Alkalibaculum sporogenes]MPW26400.1 hypothetical protein [Alkalibaculum sporogenes]
MNKSVLLANGDKVELTYTFKTSKLMIPFRTEMIELNKIAEEHGEEFDMNELEDEEIEKFTDAISKVIYAVLNGSRYNCDFEEVDFLINEELIKSTIDLMEEQKKKEKALSKKKTYPSSKKK